MTNRPSGDTPPFAAGQMVALRSDATVRGAVVNEIAGGPEPRYQVFTGAEVQTFYASQLRLEVAEERESPILSAEQFSARLTALQIRHPSVAFLYSLNAARVDFIPYQFRPVLKFIRSDRPRLLIADGVGVGKTIEAGLILRELQARHEVRSVLVICPRALVAESKWKNEMRRFDQHFTHLDSSLLRHCLRETDLEGEWPRQHEKVILPYSLLNERLMHGAGQPGAELSLTKLKPPPRFDLVIVDEAHHIRNRNTYSHQAVRFFCDHAEAAVFLTATPLQMGNADLFVLLNTLRPDYVPDIETFARMAEPNPKINDAASAVRLCGPNWKADALRALRAAEATEWGRAVLRDSAEFSRIKAQLTSEMLTTEDRVALIGDIEEMHTFSSLLSRTRRRDIGDFTVRKPETIRVAFTTGQQEVYDRLLRVKAELLSVVRPTVSVNFMMTTLRRRAASCLFGLVPYLRDILCGRVDDLESVESESPSAEEVSAALEDMRPAVETLLSAAAALGDGDPKYEVLTDVLRRKQRRQKNKVMVFSSFLHTLRYLDERLRGDGFRVGLVHGGTPDSVRLELRRRFEASPETVDALDVLLFSEVGCEGLDYQFCDCIVNYDLPWNPMRIEQRIGRVDRRGQTSESVAIVNVITSGTIDADIYDRCLERIGIFEREMGGSEEILGEIARQVRHIADDEALTDDDRRRKLQQLADNQIRSFREQERLEEGQREMFGLRVSERRWSDDVQAASSYWLRPAAIETLVTQYLRSVLGEEQSHLSGETAGRTLRLSQAARDVLLREFNAMGRQDGSDYRDWERWLKGEDTRLRVTFESDHASRHRDATFLTPLHPLVRQAARRLAGEGEAKARTALVAESPQVPSGRYGFAIYRWMVRGIREDLELRSVVESDALTSTQMDHLFQVARSAASGESEVTFGVDGAGVDEIHHRQWTAAMKEQRLRTEALSRHRKESLDVSHRARVAALKEQIENAQEAKILRMREAQLTNAGADYEERRRSLEAATDRADIVADAVAYGVIHVVEGGTHASE